ncbi:MAG TPA: hypothetical protein VF699_11070 [Caulobacteraceae bacterium]|jgi:hypothetical protein
MSRVDVLRAASLLLGMLSAGTLLALSKIEGEPAWIGYVLLLAMTLGLVGSSVALARGARR